MERILNKLKKKYGTPKLLKFLRDLNPHLSPPQKKLNKEYMRYTRFGTQQPDTPPRPPLRASSTSQPSLQSPQRPTPPRRDGARLLLPNSASLAPPVATDTTSASPPSPTPPPVIPRGEALVQSAAPFDRQQRPAYDFNVKEEITRQYKECIGELATITNRYFTPPTSSDSFSVVSPQEVLENEFIKIFKKYQAALYLAHNTKNLHHTVREQEFRFGAKKGTGKGKGKPQKTAVPRKSSKPRPPIPLTNPILMPKDIISGIETLPDTVYDDLKKRYKYEDTKAPKTKERGWINTFNQNNVNVENAITTRRHKEQCRCALCGAHMFVFSDNHKNTTCFHSTELEHQNPGSRAVELYLNVWKETIRKNRGTPQILNSGGRISAANKKWLIEYEKIFFTTIGGKHADIENMFVYCCTLCNQIKSNMLPYYINGEELQPNPDCLRHFDEKLRTVFKHSIDGKPQGLDGGIGQQNKTEADNLSKCKLNNYYGCGLVWTCQIIATFMIPDVAGAVDVVAKMKYKPTDTDNFYDGSLKSIYNIMERYTQLAEHRTPRQMWQQYVRNDNGEPSPKPRPQYPGPYFGRPVNPDGKTVVGSNVYTTLREKYTNILAYMIERLRQHRVFRVV